MFSIMFNAASPTLVLGEVVAGVFLLLYGVRWVSDAFQRITRGRVQRALTNHSQHLLVTFGIGVVTTALMQSSYTMASLLVELVSANLMSLSVAMVMLLGANVGSTLIVQLLTLPITNHALELVELGAVVALLTHRTPFRRLGQAVFGIGLIALGLAIINQVSLSFTNNPVAQAVLQILVPDPLLLILMGVGLAVLLGSGAATIGVVLTLAANGALPLPGALALVLGANVGMTLLPLFASFNEGLIAGRRLAFFHTGTKLLGVLCLLPVLGLLPQLLQTFVPNAGAQVALAHLGFNLLLALVFMPISKPLANRIEQLLPASKSDGSSAVFAPRLLDPRALSTPALAQGLATRETLRMADIVAHMLEISIQAFQERPDVIQNRIEAMDDQLDELNEAIKGYLTQLDEESLTTEQSHHEITILTIISDLEAIGDVITNRVMSLARRRSQGQIQFSEEGWEDLVFYHQQIEKALQQVLAALATQNPRLAKEFLARKGEIKQLKRDLHLRHIRQLRSDLPNSAASSAIHLDLLDAMSAVLAHASNIARTLAETT